MAPPCYADLGKQARDLFSKAFYPGQWKLEAKGKTESGTKLKASHVNSNENATLSTVECEFAWPDYGLSYVEKWNTDNQITAEVNVENQLVKGSKVSFVSSFNPTSNKKKGTVKASYKADYCNTNLDCDFDYSGPVLKASSVVGYSGILAGYQMVFDAPKRNVVGNTVSLGYDGGDYVLSASCKNGQDFDGSYYHKVSSDVEVAACGSWSNSNSIAGFTVAAKYKLSDDTNVKAKVARSGLLSLAVQQKVTDGATLTLSSAIDTMNFHTGKHCVGLGLEYDL